jgi:hypothetical protein
MMCFTSWVPEADTQYLMGWSMIGVIVLNFLVNLTIIISIALKLFYLMVKKVYRKIKHFIFPNELKKKNLRAKILREQMRALEEMKVVRKELAPILREEQLKLEEK